MLRPPSRSLAAACAVVALCLAACGDDDAANDTSSAGGPSESGDGTASTDSTGVVDVSLVPVTPPPTIPVPSVDLPAEAPTELVVTELSQGSGREAVEGDRLLVNYVGVRFEDGAEFDDSYGRDPLVVTLGAGGVIPGWEQGLLGAQAGDVLQLDVPAELAYGDTATTATTPTASAGDDSATTGTPATTGDDATTAATGSDGTATTATTGSDGTAATATAGSDGTASATTVASGPPTGPLSFVVDVLAVVPPQDAAEAPSTTDIPTYSAPVTEVLTEDVRPGDGAALDIGMTAILNLVIARADNGAVLESSWENPSPSQLPMAPTGQMDGLVEGLVGMKVGGRRIITVPFEQAFGSEGYPQEGLPAETDVVVIVDLLAAY